LINSLQAAFHAQTEIFEELKNLSPVVIEHMEKWLGAVVLNDKGEEVPFPPHQQRINDAATADVVRAKLLADRGARNRGVGGEVWHRMCNPFSQATYDGHDLSMLDAFIDYIGKVETPFAVTHPDIGRHLVAHGVCPQHQVLEVTAKGLIAADQREARDIFIKGKWHTTGSAKETPETDVFDTILSMGSALKGLRVHYWGNVLQIKQNVARDSLRHWKLEKFTKAGGIHTPDFIISMRYSPEPNLQMVKQVRIKFEGLLTISALASQYMEKARYFGDLGTNFSAVISRLNVLQDGLYYPLKVGRCANYYWQEHDLKVLRKVTIVSAEPIQEAVAPEEVPNEDLI